MTKNAAVLLFTLLASPSFAVPLHELRSLAGSCSAEQIRSCDTETFGTLETGDCLFSSGERYDRYTFSGSAGQVLEVMVRPLSSSYTKPLIALLSPIGDVAEPPVVYGGAGGATITYQLTTSGTWTIVVSSEDVFAGGSYVLHAYCYEDDTPNAPQSCVFQTLLCGQTAEWQLNADSCRFSSGNRIYAGWWIHALAGDLLQFEQESIGYEPLFGLYRDGQLLRSSERVNSRYARMSYAVAETGWYEFLTTTVEEGVGGAVLVHLDCRNSGCTFPFPLSEPPAVIRADRGAQVTIPLNVNAIGGYTTKLFGADISPVVTLPPSAASITTPPVDAPAQYFLQFENACGTWSTSSFTVAPTSSRRRSVRK